MMKNSTDRRKGPDFWVRLTQVLTIVGWLLFIVALIISYYAAPETNYGINRYHHIEVRSFWLYSYTRYLYFILWFNAALSFGCFIINSYRSKRAEDSKYFNLVLLFLVSISWFLYIYSDVQ
jgi:magnesium-transporting ATPase (P-type)